MVATRSSSRAAAAARDSISQLADDELLRVLSHLSLSSMLKVAQVSKCLARVANSDAAWAARALDICTKYNLDRDDLEGNMFYELKERPLLPQYSGPPLRMPYLTPFKNGVKISEEGLQYRCYLNVEGHLAPCDRSDHWVTTSFMCCGVSHATRAAFEAHCLDIRHYERMQGERGEGELYDSLIDPRLILGQKDFDALPKREQYLRMSKYVDAILGVLEDRSDPVNWNDADKANLQNLSRQNLSYRTRIDGMMADCDLADRVGYLRTAYARDTR